MSPLPLRLAALGFAAAALLPSLLPAQEAGKKYALVVGVETYDPRFLTRLQCPGKDATALGEALASLGFDVVAMTRDADLPARRPSTSAKILAQLAGRLKGLKPGDTLVVAFSGHGVQYSRPKTLADGSAESQFFCPEEADLTNPDSLVPIGKVYSLVEACAAERKLLLVDACRNEPLSGIGKSVREVELAPAGIAPRVVPKGMLALYSCSEGEKSYELDKDLGHGAFCHHVLKYLKGEADPKFYYRGQVSVRGLDGYVTVETRDYVFGKLALEQSPELVGRTSDWSLGPATPGLLVNSLGMRLALIPAGEFLMGSDGDDDDEKPVHRVRITQPFRLGTTEVTRGQFAAFVAAAGYRTEAESDGKGGYGFDGTTWTQDPKFTWKSPGFPQTDGHPVVNVSWNDAVAFCAWLSRKEGATYRLPTEAQWEYACRAGTATAYGFGDDPEGLAAVGNVADATGKAKFPDWTAISARDGYVFTAPVGSFRPNAFGLYDVHGNVWEWCADWYEPGYYALSPAADPSGPSGGSYRVNRGGGWNYAAALCRSANRYGFAPSYRDDYLGFRVALVPQGG